MQRCGQTGYWPRFQELVAVYQNTVLTAAQEVENGLVTFLRAQQRTQFQAASVDDAKEAVTIALGQYQAGTIDFTRVTQLEQNLVLLQDTLAQARGEIALGLIQVYRALGGGWEIRLTGCEPTVLPLPSEPGKAREILPPPTPQLTSVQAKPAVTETPSESKFEIQESKFEIRNKSKSRNPEFETKRIQD